MFCSFPASEALLQREDWCLFLLKTLSVVVFRLSLRQSSRSSRRGFNLDAFILVLSMRNGISKIRKEVDADQYKLPQSSLKVEYTERKLCSMLWIE